jgi:endonuclease/exonuclease/phosphatase family metal-dependent hydrolase
VHDNAVAESNMRCLETGVTCRSHGQHVREDREVRGHESVLDHIYMTKDLEATLSVLSDATTDHSPVVAAVSVNRVAPTTKSM